ncbi:MAG: substrate-binding domain-containing protein, partial [Chloroflexota bacterium]
MALGVMEAARFKLGIRIPEGLSVIGYDDIPTARWLTYDLTTIQLSHLYSTINYEAFEFLVWLAFAILSCHSTHCFL